MFILSYSFEQCKDLVHHLVFIVKLWLCNCMSLPFWVVHDIFQVTKMSWLKLLLSQLLWVNVQVRQTCPGKEEMGFLSFIVYLNQELLLLSKQLASLHAFSEVKQSSRSSAALKKCRYDSCQSSKVFLFVSIILEYIIALLECSQVTFMFNYILDLITSQPFVSPILGIC